MYHVSLPHAASDTTSCAVAHVKTTPLSTFLVRDWQRGEALADRVQLRQNMFEMHFPDGQQQHDVYVCLGRTRLYVSFQQSLLLFKQCRGIGCYPRHLSCYPRHLSRGQMMHFIHGYAQNILKSPASTDLLAPLQSSACAICTYDVGPMSSHHWGLDFYDLNWLAAHPAHVYVRVCWLLTSSVGPCDEGRHPRDIENFYTQECRAIFDNVTHNTLVPVTEL